MRRNNSLSHMLLGAALTLGASQVLALQEMSDDSMSEVQGAGLAFAMDDFSIRFAPTSFIEALGSDPTPQAQGLGWKRGDARYYGLSLTSGGAAGTDWYGESNGGCADGPLSCPIGTGDGDFGTTAFASVYDPFVLRVFEYEGFDYQGDWLGDDPGNLATGTNVADMPTILEFVGPSNTDPWRWSFWGQLEIGRGTAWSTSTAASGVQAYPDSPSGSGCLANGNSGYCGLQSQTLIHGKPVANGRIWQGVDSSGNDLGYTANPQGNRPAILRLMQTQNDADPTLGITYQSALSGDFRFSVRQTGDSPDALHWVPDFDDQEGLHFKNVDAFLPLGTLHYQAITFSGVSGYDENAQPITGEPQQNGNFTIELTRIPNDPNIYSHFYCGSTSGGCVLDPTSQVIDQPNPDTHGYVRWGNWETAGGSTIDPYTASTGLGTNALPNAVSIQNGIFYRDGNDVTNIGISRIEGMQIQHMKITTLGAGL